MAYHTKLPIVTDGLVFSVDPYNTKSYVSGNTITYDLVNSGLTGGTLTNGTNFINKSFSFDGTNQYIDFGDSLDMGTDNWSIDCWINLPDNNTGADSFISKSFANVGPYRYAIGLDGIRQIWSFFVGSPDLGGGGSIILGDTQLVLNTWYQVTIQFDRGSNQSIYLNGILESYTDNGGNEVGADISAFNGQDMQSNHPFRLGAYTDSDNITPVSFSNVLMGPIKIYNRLLSVNEMKQNYNALKWRFR